MQTVHIDIYTNFKYFIIMKNFTQHIAMLAMLLLAVALPSTAQVVHDRPEGTSVVYTRTNYGSCIFYEQIGLTVMSQSNEKLEIVYDGNGEDCWIKNIIIHTRGAFGEYWVHGSVERNDTTEEPRRIIVPMGQPIYEYYTNAGGLRAVQKRSAVLTWSTISFSGAQTQSATVVQSTTDTDVVYTIDGNTIHMEGTSGPVVIEIQDEVSYDATGLSAEWEEEGEPEEGEESYDGQWAGYFEWGTVAVNVSDPTIITSQPLGTLKTLERSGYSIFKTDMRAQADDFTMDKQSGDILLVNGRGNKSYIKDPLSHLQCGTWIEGTMNDEDQTFTIVLPQILYQDAATGYTTMLTWGQIETGDEYTAVKDCEVREVTFAIEGNTLRMLNSEGDASDMHATGLTAFHWDPTYTFAPEVWVETLDFSIDEPVDPHETTAAPDIDYQPIEGANGFIVTITGTEGDIFYRITRDNEVGTWSAYNTPLTLTVPGIYLIESYAVAAGKLPSEIQSLSLEIATPTTGANEAMDAKAVSSVRYYNLTGQETAHPDGVTIQVITFTDGSAQAVKVIK